MRNYIHGYSLRETQRLNEQSDILENLLHDGTMYPAGSLVLEAGCGVGAQTMILAKRSPDATFISFDKSPESLLKAFEKAKLYDIKNVSFQEADIFNLDYPEETFDHIFICFVLEHLDKPMNALRKLNKVLKRGGSITVIEGDHESCIWHPQSEESVCTWKAMIKAQQLLDHDPNIGRKVYPLLQSTGFQVKSVSPKYVYADGINPNLLDGVINKIIVPMAKTAKDIALKNKFVDEIIWEKGIQDIQQVSVSPEGTFYYSWFKGIGIKILPAF